jgi:enamine deaminase RidA (YjgF/YER057c/UK114 family)
MLFFPERNIAFNHCRRSAFTQSELKAKYKPFPGSERFVAGVRIRRDNGDGEILESSMIMHLKRALFPLLTYLCPVFYTLNLYQKYIMIKKYIAHKGKSVCIEYASEKGTKEYYVILRVNNMTIERSLSSLLNQYLELSRCCNLDKSLPVYTRIFLSDVENQSSFVINSDIYKIFSAGSVRTVGNEPLNSGKIAIISYLIKKDESFSISKINTDFYNQLVLNGHSYGMQFICNCGESEKKNINEQSKSLFTIVKNHFPKIDFKNELIRTWISIRDIDNNYIPFVEERNNFFKEVGIKSFFPASTAVEGRSSDPHKLIALDFTSISNIKKEQISKMEAPQYMSSTLKYGVSFERGLKVCFGDRAHYHLSGTASIDHNGEIMYANNIKLQVERAITNLNALLNNSNISWEHVVYLLFYVRDFKHKNEIQLVVEDILPHDIPKLYVKSSICRPGWLMEVDGIAIASGDPRFSDFI